MKKILIAVYIICLYAINALSATHWVSNSGSASWANCVGASDPSTYCSLATANTNAVAGDVIYMKAGTYSYSTAWGYAINPTNSGTLGNLITYSRIPTEDKPHIVYSNSAGGASLVDRSYIKLDGIKFTAEAYTYTINMVSSSHYNEIANCELYSNGLYPHTTIPLGSLAPSNHNWIHHNIITARAGSACSEGGDGIRIGGARAGYYSLNNTIENNTFYNSGHAHIDAYSHRYTVIRNNVAHNEPWWDGTDTCDDRVANYTNNSYDGLWGHRNFQVGYNGDSSKTYTLLEGNRTSFQSANPGNAGDSNLTIAGQGVLVRYNDSFAAQRMGIGFKYVNSATDGMGGGNSHVYNNTIYHSGYGYEGGGGPATYRNGAYKANYDSGSHTGNIFKNNIVYDSADGDFDPTFQTYVTTENNLCTSAASGCTVTGDPLFADTDITDVTSTTKPDLTLQSGSSAINAGTYLTQANGSGSSSTTLIVDDSEYFQCGSSCATTPIGSSLSNVVADTICIGTVSNCVQISDINYSTNTITIASAITWSDDAYIWLKNKSDGVQVLYGDAPDMGAHEYTSEADTTATTTTISTSDSTITVNSLTVTGMSIDAVGVSGCKFRIGSAPDASNGTACSGTTSFSCATSGYASGANTLYVGCYDAAGNYGSDSIIVTFTPPTASGCSFSGGGMVR